jgi:dTDP-glucose 4,6-dehydratase
MKILITGTAGFIGSNLVRYLLDTVDDLSITSLDSLDYAGDRINLESIPGGIESDRHRFVHGNICDPDLLDKIASDGLDGIINLAAHTHVDRAYYHPETFIRNNVEGVLNLLRTVKKHKIARYLQISTDEVYGSTTPDSPMHERAPLRPGNYYSSSKAAADLYIAAAVNTDKIDAVIVRGTNNFGPRQFPEKIIPFFTRRIILGKTLPLYGDGRQMRDWLYVTDFCRAIWTVFTRGKCGEIYNAGADNHLSNVEMSRRMVDILGADPGLIRHVDDRPGHDFCYAVDWSKIAELGWQPRADFETRLIETVGWYRDNQEWVEQILATAAAHGDDKKFFDNHYRNRT